MKKPTKTHLLLEQLEERIFLDANPLAAAEPVDPVDIPADDTLSLAADTPQASTEQIAERKPARTS